jgi:transcriptional regulator with XRE-family HTH domain
MFLFALTTQAAIVIAMRRINLEALKFWLSQNGSLAKEDLASRSRIKFYTIGRIIDGVREPSELEQTAICKATGLTMDELFPVSKQEKSVS